MLEQSNNKLPHAFSKPIFMPVVGLNTLRVILRRMRLINKYISVNTYPELKQ